MKKRRWQIFIPICVLNQQKFVPICVDMVRLQGYNTFERTDANQSGAEEKEHIRTYQLS